MQPLVLADLSGSNNLSRMSCGDFCSSSLVREACNSESSRINIQVVTALGEQSEQIGPPSKMDSVISGERRETDWVA